MIHTVTFNPALDLTYRVSELKLDDKLRTTDVFRSLGGGVNISRVAALRLGIACGTATATTPGTEVCTKEMVEALLLSITVERL
jgi:fructose-1-phosphate kinase PfkB-like protein